MASTFAAKHARLTAQELARYRDLNPIEMTTDEAEAAIDGILGERALREAPQFRQGASLRESRTANLDRFGKAVDVLIDHYGWDGTHEENIENLREMIEQSPEAVREELNEIAPGLLDHADALESEFHTRRYDLSGQVAKRLDPFLSDAFADTKSGAALLSARDRAVLDGLTPDAASGLIVRELVTAGRAGDLLDGARTPEDEERLFRLMAQAPADPVVDPNAHLTDAQLERALLGGETPRDRIVAPGVSVEYQYTNDPEEQLEALRREVAEMDAAAAKHAAERDDDPNGSQRFFRPN